MIAPYPRPVARAIAAYAADEGTEAAVYAAADRADRAAMRAGREPTPRSAIVAAVEAAATQRRAVRDGLVRKLEAEEREDRAAADKVYGWMR